MEAHSRSNVSYHSSRSEGLPRMSHSSQLTHGGDGQRFTALDIGRTQRGIEIAARCTWSSKASPFYGPFDISACHAPPSVGRSRAKLLFLHILCKIARSECCCCWLTAWVGTLKARGRPHRMPLPDSQYSMPIHSSPVILQILVLCTTPRREGTRIR